MRAIKASDALLGNDEQSQAWIAWTKAEEASGRSSGGGAARSSAAGDVAAGDAGPRQGLSEDGASARSGLEQTAEQDLAGAIERGDADGAPELVESVIAEGCAPGDVIETVLTPAIQKLGDAFGRGEVFLPQLMVSAEAMKAAVAQVKTHLPDTADSHVGRVVFATVKGDIHSIGKDICVSLLESQGFDVEDLGVDVEVETVAEAAVDADAVCLSALMTTTLPAMQRTVESVGETQPDTPVFVGGAVVTREWASQIGAGYSDDAPGCVEAVREAVAG
jgi:5-methyltetrahydrofolate--homocysteine methyltransferase